MDHHSLLEVNSQRPYLSNVTVYAQHWVRHSLAKTEILSRLGMLLEIRHSLVLVLAREGLRTR